MFCTMCISRNWKTTCLIIMIVFDLLVDAIRVDHTPKLSRSHSPLDVFDREWTDGYNMKVSFSPMLGSHKLERDIRPTSIDQLAIIRMKDRIKQVLNMKNENTTWNEYVFSVFNIENLNPTYVFLLPSDEKNKIHKIIYQKSDFMEAEFPNVTTLNKFKRSLNISNELQEADYPDPDLKSFAHNADNDDVEDSMLEIVADNIRTERSFIKFMEELNDDLEDELKRQALKHKQKLHSSSSPKRTHLFTPYTYVNTQTVGWDDLGLEGWSGGLREVTSHKFEQPVLERPKSAAVLHEPVVSIQTSFDPLKFRSTPVSTNAVLPSAVANTVLSSSTSAPQRSRNPGLILSSELEDKLEEIYNRTKTIPGKPPRWPITNSRDAHRNEDVFIARANNPFGHSTKWRWSNESDEMEREVEESVQSREGRSKRGVYNLYSMIKCATGCDPIIYKGYGCYCGFLGSGQAMDGIDRCCKMHDYCYTTAKCPMFLEYFVPYLWKCYGGRPLCAVDHGEWGGPNACASRLCHCDLSLSKCLRRYHCPRKRNVCTNSPLRLLQNLLMVF